MRERRDAGTWSLRLGFWLRPVDDEVTLRLPPTTTAHRVRPCHCTSHDLPTRRPRPLPTASRIASTRYPSTLVQLGCSNRSSPGPSQPHDDARRGARLLQQKARTTPTSSRLSSPTLISGELNEIHAGSRAERTDGRGRDSNAFWALAPVGKKADHEAPAIELAKEGYEHLMGRMKMGSRTLEELRGVFRER